jgi:uncharacterized protein (TIGR02569 family)
MSRDARTTGGNHAAALRPPSRDVVAAFGGNGDPAPLSGRTGRAWRAGDIVLKPLALMVEELEWQAEVLGRVRPGSVRVAPPRRAHDGSLAVDGWTAWEYVAGSHEARRWIDAIHAGDAFHAALAGERRPAFLDRRTDPWSVGDRVAWGELPTGDFADMRHVERLAAAMRPLRAPSQLVHGDLGGNVLFADGLPPAVIDFSPYWRPVGYAAAIVVADALVWEGADATIFDGVGDLAAFDQLLLRALVYRLVAGHLLGVERVDPDGEDLYARAVELALRLASGG